MSNVNIIDTTTNEYIAENLEAWGITDCLVNVFCDNSTPAEIYEACTALGEAYTSNEPCEAYEAYLGVSIEAC